MSQSKEIDKRRQSESATSDPNLAIQDGEEILYQVAISTKCDIDISLLFEFI